MSVVELESFSLTGNKLRSLRNILKFKAVFNIFVSENQIQYLSDEDFRFVYMTEYLELRENQIRRIDTDTFKFLRTSLMFLDLTSNLLTSLNGSISYLSQLIRLNLGDNLIQVAFLFWYTHFLSKVLNCTDYIFYDEIKNI